MSTYKCSCFCKSVQFEATLKNLDLVICHCSMCRKLAGSTGFASLEFANDVTFFQKEYLSVFNSSEFAERGFCSNCGTTLFDHFKPAKAFFVPPAVIENLPEEKIQFVEEIYFDNKPSYYSYANKTKTMNESDFK